MQAIGTKYRLRTSVASTENIRLLAPELHPIYAEYEHENDSRLVMK
jgi:hypothetical protein